MKAPNVKPPPIPPPQAIPQVAIETGEDAIRKQASKSGFVKAIKTGDLVPKSTGRNTTLGGTYA